jgi:ATP-dependent RNA helicase SUPV3L1/SUV3
MNLQKFDGEDIRYLTSQEIKQIGGRAGRKGIYDTGYVGTVGLEQNFIRENLETQDEPLSRAVLGPGEAIINIKGLPLKEKLALWSTRSESLRYYRKMDIRDYLLILENLKYFKLPEEIQYRLMNLPFDVNDDDTMDCFVNYVDEFFNEDYGSISKPRLSGYLLYDYEKYYQMLNLYYSFSKNFNVNFEPEWVYGERKRVSKIINELLVKL